MKTTVVAIGSRWCSRNLLKRRKENGFFSILLVFSCWKVTLFELHPNRFTSRSKRCTACQNLSPAFQNFFKLVERPLGFPRRSYPDLFFLLENVVGRLSSIPWLALMVCLCFFFWLWKGFLGSFSCSGASNHIGICCRFPRKLVRMALWIIRLTCELS